MSIRKLRSGRVPTVTRSEYIGERGSIFWDETTGYLYLSDGVTPGGHDIGLPAASSTRLGGIKLGPGVVLNSDGQVIIDSTGLDFSFGDFQATTPANGAATLSSIHVNQDVDIVSNGTGVINMIGDFHVHRTADYNPNNLNASNAVFAVKADGQVQMKVPLSDSTTAAFEVVGNDSGLFFSPNQTGVILHTTGNSGLVGRNYFDANANYALLVGRRYNGTQSSPTKVLNGELFFRIAGQASTQATTEPANFQTFGPCQIDWVATEDQGPNNQGGELRFRATPNGSSSQSGITQVASMNATTGLTAIKFNGPLTGNVTGNVSGNAGTVTNGVYTSGSYSDPSWLTISKSKVGLGNVENTALSTSTYYIGTTQNTYGRASGAQTLSGVSISGNAGTVTNGVYTTDTGTVTNTMLAGSIANNKLSNSTISGIALGNTLNAITAGHGLQFSSGTTYDGSTALTLNRYEAVTGPVTVVSNAYALNLGTCNGLVILNNAGAAITITISNPVEGKIVRVIALGMAGATKNTVSGLTAANSSNGTNQYQATSNNSSAVIVEFYCTTTALSGVYMNLTGAK